MIAFERNAMNTGIGGGPLMLGLFHAFRQLLQALPDASDDGPKRIPGRQMWKRIHIVRQPGGRIELTEHVRYIVARLLAWA